MIIAKFASVCTRSCKLKYLTLCVLVDCTVRLSEKGIVIVPFSFSLLIFFFFSFHCSPFSSYYQVYCELLCCENSNESRVFFLLSRANTDTIQIIRNNYSDTQQICFIAYDQLIPDVSLPIYWRRSDTRIIENFSFSKETNPFFRVRS